ncbi:MAG: DUF2179 domain-containing protein [Phycisphaerae bacterium]|nr:DUF2179 domain-containing protein [Phycisphaerae bacterium]
MEDNIFANSDLYAWVVLPFLIFLARIADVSIGTIRLIFVSRGLKYLAPLVGFLEVLIWLLAIGQIMNNLSNPVCYIAYAGGFAMGNFIGMWIAEKLSLGVVLIRVITNKDATELINCLKSDEYGVTCVEGRGRIGKVQVVFTIVPRCEVKSVINLVKTFNPKAFYTIEEVGFVEKGLLAPKGANHISGFFRPFRKGK